ncbi:putative 9-cis-epoxycarotenoid dioxygenase [Abeliophyllum distichum]|uniref:9-cis-epoxycarotenoid dioxygenase n=1 Tax=Abeliophyllum distichum TaxID=126358 RepID=A0ABD1TWS4_9LAMI
MTGPNPLFGGLLSAVSLFGRTSEIWIEGEGMLHALYLSKSSGGSNWNVIYNNKYVGTDTFLLQKEREKPALLPAVEGDPLVVLSSFVLNMLRFGIPNKRMSNTNVFEHSGKFYSISENYIPQEIDILTLLTLGNWDLNGAWTRPFTSHPKYEKEEYARIGVMPRYGNADSIRWFPVEASCAFHIINCFEDDDEDEETPEELVKVEYHMFPSNTFCSGSTFVLKNGAVEEDDGWIITFLHNEDINV